VLRGTVAIKIVHVISGFSTGGAEMMLYRLGCAARRRIEKHFSLSAIAARYEQLYEEIVAPASTSA
jgi:glycosyltransferase involved in cell wall biosynthesis